MWRGERLLLLYSLLDHYFSFYLLLFKNYLKRPFSFVVIETSPDSYFITLSPFHPLSMRYIIDYLSIIVWSISICAVLGSLVTARYVFRLWLIILGNFGVSGGGRDGTQPSYYLLNHYLTVDSLKQITLWLFLMATQDHLNSEGRRRALTLASRNVCGLKNPMKRGNVFAHLKSLLPDNIFTGN